MLSLTAMGSMLSSDDMVAKKGEEDELEKVDDKKVDTRLHIGEEFKKKGKDFGDYLILKSRFQDNAKWQVL